MKKVLFFALSLALLISCRKEDLDLVDGPDLNDLYGPFDILSPITPTSKSIDFSAGSIYFLGELTKNTEWQIQLKGATSGATKTITGFERIISENNATWDGGAGTFPGFNVEDVYVQISFPNETDAVTLYDTLSITNTKVDEGFFITGFESGIGSNWQTFNQATVTGAIACGSNASAKGDCHYGFNGTVTWDWAIGSVTIVPDSGTFGLPNAANNLWFNLAFKALENFGPDNSFIQVWFDEDDDGNGTFDEASEDRYIYDYWSQDSTWDLISKTYESLAFDETGAPVEVNGNGLPEPSKLVSINIFFLANPNNGNARALVDHLIFTTGKPYAP